MPSKPTRCKPTRCKPCEWEYRRAQRGRSPEARERQRLFRRCEPGVAATCRQCGRVGLPPDDFYAADRYFCKPCRAAFDAARHAKLTPEQKIVRGEKMRRSRLARVYGITPAKLEEMFKAQNSGCAICGVDLAIIARTRGKRQALHIDHSHATGKVRGLLCAPCNQAIGLLKDDPALMRKAAEYVEAHK